MEKVIEKEKCCGCHACMNKCPKDAISMEEDRKGFKYPVIDQDKCINCKLCQKVCPVLNKHAEKEHDIEAYACYNTNLDERLNSSSGGIFILLAKEIIKRKGVVFGAAFDNDFNVYHTYVTSEKDLSKFMGSKYTQSTIGDTYKKVKELLNQDKCILFTGTPCQIEGLKSYLKKDYKKLYTQDIICHGVPSPKVWRKYLKYQEQNYKEKVRNVSFRNKDHGWSLYRTIILFDTNRYSESHNKDLFMRAFLCNICLRDSCYDCPFKKKYRISDITLADYWGIDKIQPELNDNKGTSLVVVNSNKGKELFDIIKNNLKYIETDLDTAIKYNCAMTMSVNHCKNEKEFIDSIDNLDFSELINKYVPKPPIYRKVLSKIKKIISK